ncbi:hypothetical protein [Massilia brevitalea]|uniref:hypothetical protein n=1 Tax=Massilia brevitalea TaxID=442526 RepID=UPI002739A5A3|nr:hypothetical protein [Massilia brevitalea]
MWFSISRYLLRGAVLGVFGALGGCTTGPSLQPFSTDGCSLFPDRAPLGQADWCGCCVAHDLAYWRGGSAAERLESDRVFRECVRAASRSPALGGAMYGAVRAGGVPWLPSPFRWGYGWDYDRLYRTLSLEEDAQANALRAAYLAKGTAAVCKP